MRAKKWKTEPISPITNETLLVVEGPDDAYLVDEILENEKCDIKRCSIVDINGDEIHSQLPVLLKSQNFDKVKSFGIMWDADHSPDQAFKKIVDIIRGKPDLPIPDIPGVFKSDGNVAVGVFLAPGNGPGRLEDLFLRSFALHCAMPCVDAYMSCLERVQQQKLEGDKNDPRREYLPRDMGKAKCLALLAAMHESTSQIGYAAQKHYWDVNHECLNPLREFLRSLATFGGLIRIQSVV